MFKKNYSRMIALVMAVLVLFSNGMVAMAADNETSVDFTVEATDIDITVPLNFACTIDPNIEEGFAYADNLTVTNNSTAPILLSVNAFADSDATFENDVLPDGLPDGLEWNDLNVKQTKQYFALGLKAKDATEWFESYLDDFTYAKTINEAGAKTDFGVIGPASSTNFDLDASYGRAVKEGFTFSYKITWLAELYEPTV
jgi:hypothetical protein